MNRASVASSRKRWIWVIPALAFLGSVGADPSRQDFRFEGKAIPDPPRQREPWTPPPTQLPRFLATATGPLFDAGLADPRGCEYREVELGEGPNHDTHGFVFRGEGGPFVVGWDGLIRPALSVGRVVDLAGDVRQLAEAMIRDRTPTGPPVGRSRGFGQAGFQGGASPGLDGREPLRVVLLLRLGRADLAEALFAAGTVWTPEPRPVDLTDYGISYVTLARDWAAAAFGRLISAHERADDGVALDLARRLARFRDAVEARADARGFPRPGPRDDRAARATRFEFLGQLDALLADHERRAKLPPRTPVPPPGGDPSARIAALVRDLDQIDERQMMSPGGASPGSSPIVADLVAEGDAAVPALLAVLESDDRLTRSVDSDRTGGVHRFVHQVHEAASSALVRILRTNQFQTTYGRSDDREARAKLAVAMRTYWEKNRAVPLAERWYRMLLDDKAGVDRWLEAAGGLASPVVDPANPRRRGKGPKAGEPLRVGRDPSITALMIRRAEQIAAGRVPLGPGRDSLATAASLATSLVAWDEPASPPTLQWATRALIDRDLREESNRSSGGTSSVPDLTMTRARLGDLGGLDDYAGWVRKITPKTQSFQSVEALKPLWSFPDRPSLAEAGRALFQDPKSPWRPLVPDRREGRDYMTFDPLIASPLLTVAGFREGLLAALGDRSRLGTVEPGDDGMVRFTMVDGTSGGFRAVGGPDLEARPGAPSPFRACDFVAWKLSEIEGAPRCDLAWPEARRDEAVAAASAFLVRFAARFTAEAPPGQHDFPHPRAHLKFPSLGRPATADDVRRNDAIFTLEGMGEVRPAGLPAFPLAANRIKPGEPPPDGRRQFRPSDQVDGWVWQAEEVREGDHWTRFHGFAGRGEVARVPAAEIEYAVDPYRWGRLSGGFDSQLWSPAAAALPDDEEIPPPSPLGLRLRNRKGIAQPAPIEFLRRGPDGMPALRRGITPTLLFSKADRPIGPFGRNPQAEVPCKPTREAYFEPNAATFLASPLEALDAGRIDPSDWFDLSEPGLYRFAIEFTAESGLGSGRSNEWYFRVAPK